MATLNYFLPTDRISIESGSGSITVNRSNRIEVTYSSGKTVIKGFDLDASGNSRSGTVTSYEWYQGNTLAFRMNNFQEDLSDVMGGGRITERFALRNEDIVHGSYGNDTINGRAGDDKIWTWGGDDYIVDFWGNDTVDGGNGLDTFQVRKGSRDQHRVSVENDGTIKVQRGENGQIETLKNIERVVFNDGQLAFDTEGNAGQAYRLYQAAFDRMPDAGGLGFWIDHYDAGNVNLVEMAGYFMQSAEFATKYGDPETVSDEAFLTLLYNNVLDRDPDQEGFDFWRGHQENGLSRAEILQHFSESEENYANVAGAIEDGIWYL